MSLSAKERTSPPSHGNDGNTATPGTKLSEQCEPGAKALSNAARETLLNVWRLLLRGSLHARELPGQALVGEWVELVAALVAALAAHLACSTGQRAVVVVDSRWSFAVGGVAGPRRVFEFGSRRWALAAGEWVVWFDGRPVLWVQPDGSALVPPGWDDPEWVDLMQAFSVALDDAEDAAALGLKGEAARFAAAWRAGRCAAEVWKARERAKRLAGRAWPVADGRDVARRDAECWLVEYHAANAEAFGGAS